MIDVNYPPEMIRKAKAIVRMADRLPNEQRTAWCQDFCGLSYQYLYKIGEKYKQPSTRTLMNLGYELYARDVATGETFKLELNQPCDWNPRNPKMNPTSSKVFVEELEPESSTSE